MDQYAEAFKEEARELLSDLEQTLLILENEHNNMELIGQAFRALHTLKGSGSMFGFDDVAMFIHDIESVFDLIRNNELKFNKEIADLTLLALDEIDSMIFTGKEKLSKSESARILNTFRNILKKQKSNQEEEKLLKSKSYPETEGQTDKVQDEEILNKYNTFKLTFKPNSEIFNYGSDPQLLLNELRELGKVVLFVSIEDIPAIDKLNPELCYLKWQAIIFTTSQIEQLKDVFIFVEDVSELDFEELDFQTAILPDAFIEYVQNLFCKNEEISKEKLKFFFDNKESETETLKYEYNLPAGTGNIKPQVRIPKEAQSIRVSSEKLDELINLVGELVTAQAGLSQIVPQFKNNRLSLLAEQIEYLSWELRDSTLNIRMLPIGTTFSRFNRLIRDVSKDLGKEVTLITEGAETELDKNVLEKLNDPLIHILRNSIDHGIERPDERIRNNKLPNGTIKLAATQSGGNVEITITDDGKGLDKDKILKKAIEKKIVLPTAELSEAEIFNLIFAPGFSTSDVVTNLSGRGVGMDVVKKAIEGLRGTVEIQSEKLKGTAIKIRIPLTLAIIDGLMINISEEKYIIPLSLIDECIELTAKDIENSHNRNMVNLRDEIIPFIRLREYFSVEGKRPSIEQIVIISMNGKKTGLVVDSVLGHHQTVLKSLGKFYKNVKGISGATILGNGSVALILDVLKIISHNENIELKKYHEPLNLT